MGQHRGANKRVSARAAKDGINADAGECEIVQDDFKRRTFLVDMFFPDLQEYSLRRTIFLNRRLARLVRIRPASWCPQSVVFFGLVAEVLVEELNRI